MPARSHRLISCLVGALAGGAAGGWVAIKAAHGLQTGQQLAVIAICAGLGLLLGLVFRVEL
ncbi:MAG: hypothetical protein KDA44_10975 [Planctomycetales bacterium]|nr:hypothetical protein [Planctomycetales bacterium]